MTKILSLQLGFARFLRSIVARQSAAHSFLWVLLTLPFIVSSSKADVDTPPWQIATAETAVNRVPFQTIAKGYRSGVLGSLQTVARNPADWAALWKTHTSTESNSPPLPAVDFAKEIVIAVFLGEKPTGGHDIEITGVEPRDGGLAVSFVERSPQPGGVVTQAFTQPFHIVRVATQSSGKVTFRRLS